MDKVPLQSTRIPIALLTWWKNLRKRHKLVAYLIITGLVVLSGPTVIQRATGVLPRTAEFYFLEAPRTYITGQNFPVELRVRTGDTAINSMGFVLEYDVSKLEVQRMTTDTSFCTLFTDNIFDNQRGTVKVSCGKPTPGFTGDSLAVRVTFRAKTAGNVSLKINQASSLLLANDGKGSNISKESPELRLYIQQF
jgi:hypothetical protein